MTDLERIAVGELCCRGAFVLGAQHGGTYGESIPTVPEMFERLSTDRYLTWGWSQRPTDVRAPALRPVTQLRKGDSAGGDDILWPSNRVSLSRYASPTNVLHDDRYERRQAEIWSALGEGHRKVTILRLRQHNFGIGEDYAGWLRELLPGITVDPGSTPIRSAYRSARVVLLDRLFTTTFLECLYLGLPAVVSVEPRSIQFARPEAAPYVHSLIETGVICLSAPAMTRSIEEAYESRANWMNHPQRRSALRAYKDEFCFTTDRSVDTWTDRVLESVRALSG